MLVNASPIFFNKPMIELAKLLTDISCFDRVFFTSTGAEANEGAIKLAGKYGAKYLNGAFEIITTANSFHGLLIAFDLPDPIGSRIVSECLREGLIVNSPQPYTIRLMPPLIVTKYDVDNMIQILSKVLDRMSPG